MNRDQKRDFMKNGASKGTIDKMSEFEKPASLREVISISRASAEDVVSDFQRQTSPLQIAVSLQLEAMKSLLLKSGVFTEEAFRDTYMEKVDDFNKRKREFTGEDPGTPKMEVKVSDINVKTEE